MGLPGVHDAKIAGITPPFFVIWRGGGPEVFTRIALGGS